MPMRPGMFAWFEGLFDALKAKKYREALYRVTFEGGLANLVLQLFVPSCRDGALSAVSLLLYGYQTTPAAFHSCLPALRHVFTYLIAEESTQIVKSEFERNSDVSALFCSSLLLRSVEDAPVFDVASPFTDVTTHGKVKGWVSLTFILVFFFFFFASRNLFLLRSQSSSLT